MASTDMTVANTILAQLGGGRFRAMTGARDFVGGENFLQFGLPSAGPERINKIRIEYNDAHDLYSVALYRQRRRGGIFDIKMLDDAHYLDVEAMRAYISGRTGLALSL